MSKNNICQVVLPFNLGYALPKNDPVVILDEICNEMDFSPLSNIYNNKWFKYNPIVLFKVVIYAYMNSIYSSRDIERECERNICFMYLLNGMKAPDHTTIARFQNKTLTGVMENIFYELIERLSERNEIQFKNLFVDGTKIEANANRYTFVWKKATEKFEERTKQKFEPVLNEIKNIYNISQNATVEQCLNILFNLKEMYEINFSNSKGTRKTQLQKDIEKLQQYLKKIDNYKEKSKYFKGRNSYSKTDTDATFMHLKEDHMKNGQLKPAYNIQIGVESEYIVSVDTFSSRNDVNTLVPFLDNLYKFTNRKYENLVADAGYESEENYEYLRKNNITAYIKPQNYEQSKTKKYKSNMFLAEKMTYNIETDTFTCVNGNTFNYIYTSKEKTASGYIAEKRMYKCENCNNCPHRQSCYKSKKECRIIQYSHKFMSGRKQSLENISTQEGIILRTNRSIQAEGAFGVIKEDKHFRRFLTRNKVKTKTQILLIAFAFNICKLFNRINKNRYGKTLFCNSTA